MTDEQQRTGSAVDRLVDSLRGGGVEEGAGEWTMSADQAKEKLGQFLLASPHHYVLPLVQAAVLRGAIRIYFEIDRDDVRLRFHSQPFTLRELQNLYDTAFSTDLDPVRVARRQLALGLNAALHLKPSLVRLVSGAKGEYAELEVRPDRPDRCRALERGERGTEILVRGRRLGADAPTPVAQGYPEEHVLRERCRYSACQIFVNGEPVANGLRLPEAASLVAIHGRGFHGLGGFVPSQVGTDEIRIVQHGAWTATHELGTGAHGFLAIVEGDRLRTDVSQTAILQDEAFESMLAAVREAHRRLSRRNDLVTSGEQDAIAPIRFEVRQLAGAHRDRLRRRTGLAVTVPCAGAFASTTLVISRLTLDAVVVYLLASLATIFAGAIAWPRLKRWIAGRRAFQRASIAAFNRKFRPGSIRRAHALAAAGELASDEYGHYDLLVPRIAESDRATAPGGEPGAG